MEELCIDLIFNGVHMNACFSNSVNFLCGDSGTGKTFLMHGIELYCANNGISCQYVDSRARGKSEDYILSMCLGSDVVMLDNAALYLTPSLYTKLREHSKYLIISIKDRSALDTGGTACHLWIGYN